MGGQNGQKRANWKTKWVKVCVIERYTAVSEVGIPLIAVCSHLDLKSGTPQPLMLRIQDLIDYLQFQFKAGLLPLSKSLKAYRLRRGYDEIIIHFV